MQTKIVHKSRSRALKSAFLSPLSDIESWINKLGYSCLTKVLTVPVKNFYYFF